MVCIKTLIYLQTGDCSTLTKIGFFSLFQKVGGAKKIHITFSREDKLKYLSPSVISSLHQKDEDQTLTELEGHIFNSVTGSVEFSDETVSPIATFIQNYLQQKRSGPKIQHITKQSSILRHQKQFGAACQFRSSQLQGIYSIYRVCFDDAARPSEHGQLRSIGVHVTDRPVRRSTF